MDKRGKRAKSCDCWLDWPLLEIYPLGRGGETNLKIKNYRKKLESWQLRISVGMLPEKNFENL